MANLNWKSKLLSSGVPLEFDVAKILVEKGLSVAYDYSYRRLDDIDNKEFSVDLHADSFFPLNENSPIRQTVDFLIECKYRTPNKKWIFLPELLDNANNSYSSALKLVDEFSKYSFESRLGSFLEYNLCMKGIEINVASGDAHDSDIKHGSLQLLYAMPVLLHHKIHFVLREVIDELYPFSIIPILVTNAELFVAHEDFGLEKVGVTQNFEDLCSKVDCIKFHVNLPASFANHCHNIFNDFSNDNLNEYVVKNLEYLNKLRHFDLSMFAEPKNKHLHVSSNPKHFLSSLRGGYLPNFFEEILVCNISHLPELINKTYRLIESLENGKQVLE